MKTALKLLTCLVLAATVAGCASTGAGPAGGGEPARWSRFPAWNQYGITVGTNLDALITGPSALVVSARPGCDLVLMYSSLDGARRGEMLHPERDGDRLTFSLNITQDGSYQLMLLGKPSSESGEKYAALGRAQVTVRIDQAAAAAAATAARVVLTPAANKYGLAFSSTPETDVGDLTELALSMTTDFQLSYSFMETSAKKDCSDQMSSSHHPGSIKITLGFPETGDYEMALYGKPQQDDAARYEELVRVKLHAVVDQAKAPAVPSFWKAGPGMRKFGVVVTAAGDPTVKDSGRLAFTTAKKVSLSWYYVKKTGEKDSTSVDHDLVEDTGADTDHAVTYYVGEKGDYELGLFGRPEGSDDSILIARVPFSASVTDHSGALPPGWKVEPRFWKYGITVASSPDGTVGDTASVVVHVPQGVKVEAELKEQGSGRNVLGQVDSTASGTELRFDLLFTKSGSYLLTLRAQAEGDKGARNVAALPIQSRIDDAAIRYRLWAKGWPILPVTGTAEVQGDWVPLDKWSKVATHQRGTLSGDLTVEVAGMALTLRKGSTVEFVVDSDGALIDTLAFPLAMDLTVKMGSTTATLKSGTLFAMDRWTFAGTIAKDSRLSLNAGVLAVAKGTRLYAGSNAPYTITPRGTATFTNKSGTYECTDDVNVLTPGECSDFAGVSITTTRDIPLKFATTIFTLPRGSAITFTNDGIDHVVFIADTEVSVGGQRQTVHAGWAAKFAPSGAMETYQAE